MKVHQERLFSALHHYQREELAGLLRRLGLNYESETDGTNRRFELLGIPVRAAHLARQQRSEVGLSDRVGVLIVAVDDDAGPLHQGDLVVAANGEPVASILDLASHAAVVSVVALRGDIEHHIVLDN